jgi:thermostable 8-oxoguanine DNA glycosylase
MNRVDDIRGKLSRVARSLAKLKRPLLESLKANHADLARDDFLWHYLLQSFATLGGVSGWDGLIGNDANYRKMSYEIFSDMAAPERLPHATELFTTAKVRYANRKAPNIVACFDKIHAMGGLLVAKETLLHQKGREGKIAFLKSFPGIGDKYARNIMMDVYHEDFRDSIAIDIRIQAISTQWELKFASYVDHESFYMGVAEAAQLNGWELDRLMFRFQTVFYPPIAADD